MFSRLDRRILFLGSVFALLLGPECLVAQEPTRAVWGRFEEASALEIDPMGRLYVTDAGLDVVRIFNLDGEERATVGGSGTRRGEFDGPMDLDATNGQMLVVADAGNGRIQRFASERQYLDALTVGATFEDGPEQRVFSDGRDGADVQGSGRPIAVVSSNSDETFVIDGREDVVVKFDAQAREERIIGGAGHLQAPVALALDGNRRLYVADRERKAVFSYDLFGTFVERLSTPTLPRLQALSVYRGRLWIICADRVLVWNPDAGTIQQHQVSLDVPLVDAARRGNHLFLLTESELLRRDSW